MSHQWDPERYLVYADERGRPFVDLLARVGATDPGRVVDLGCGPGNLTVLLKERWPSAEVVGVDSSPEMVARAASVEGIRVERGDVRTWRPGGLVDVLFSNATYQWVPGHLDLLADLVGHVAPGGWFAFQVPGNHDEPSLLTGEDPVFTWISGTGARPTLQALPGELRAVFVEEYKALLRAAYPPGRHGTTLPFRRVFVSATRHLDGGLSGASRRK